MMASKKKADVSTLPQPIVFTGMEKMAARNVVKSTDLWSEYKLDDGAVIKVKPIIIQIKRVVGKHHLNGDPIYMVQAGLAIDTVVPTKLRKQKAKKDK